MFKNIYFDNKNNQIHLWKNINNEDIYDIYDWVPYVYVDDFNGHIKTIYGTNVSKKTFKTSYDKRQYEKKRTIGIYENQVIPTIQFLSEYYHNIKDEDIISSKLKIGIIDIEVYSTGTFPDFNNPIYEINAISLYNNINKMIYTFGLKKLNKKYDNNTEYIHCENEKELLIKFIDKFKNFNFDILSGWNCIGFDIPYIIERIKYLFGEDTTIYKRLSPINIISIWRRKSDGKYNIEIAGITIIDYLDAYKYFSRQTPRNYKLDTIAELELGVGKIDYSEYGQGATGLNNLYIKNFDKFIYYNQIDVKRIGELEEKLAFIQGNIYGAALLTKTPMQFYNVQTKLIEGALLTYFRRHGLCAPYMKYKKHLDWYPGAYVKNPIESGTYGLHEWVTSVDIKSSYPSHMISLNMSIETYFGKIETYLDNNDYYIKNDILDKKYKVIDCIYNKKLPPFNLKTKKGIKYVDGINLQKFNLSLKRKLFSIAPCGTIFRNDKKGIMAQVQKDYFLKRRQIKTEMKKAKKNGDKIKEEQLYSSQLALKTTLNSMYGATAVEYSRYFNPDISIAITTCGQNTIRQSEKIVNDILNNNILYDNIKQIIQKYN